MRRQRWLAGAATIGLAAVGVGLIRRRQRTVGVSWRDPGPAEGELPLAVRDSGGGDAVTVLLLHGLAGSSRYWGADYDTLATDGRLVVADLLGFGSSPRPPGRYGLNEHVDAVMATLDDLGVTGPVVIGAHSVGSIVAAGVAARAPDRVAGLVLFGPPLYTSSDQARLRIGGLGGLGRLLALDTPVAHRVCGWMCGHRALAARIAVVLRPDLPAAIARDSVQHNWVSYSGTMRNVIIDGDTARGLTDAIDAMKQTEPIGATRPDLTVHIIVGDRDLVPDFDVLEALAAANPSLRVDRWDGAHDLPLRNPRRCIAAIMDMRDAATLRPQRQR